MNVTLKQAAYATHVTAPPSKSVAHRLLIAAAFADKPTTLRIATLNEDIEATVRCLVALGASIIHTGDTLTVTPISPESCQKNALLDCGESGSTLRFLLPVCGAIGANATFLRRGRLGVRPLEPLATELKRHGMELTEEGDLLSTKGHIRAGEYSIDGSVSSQYVTGLLFALSLLPAPSTLTLTGRIESAPYIAITEEALAKFGVCPIRTQNTYRLAGYKEQPFKTTGALSTDGDFSGAAFPLALGAIGTHPVTVTGLTLPSSQGDSAIVSLLAKFGAAVSVEENGITVSPAPLRALRIDATDIPDLVPILCVVAAAAEGTTVITGAARLRLKESDRLLAVQAMLSALGGKVTKTEDGLVIEGNIPLHGGEIDSFGDHRIAMSAAAASLLTTEEVRIKGAHSIAKSYPAFFDDVIFPTRKEPT